MSKKSYKTRKRILGLIVGFCLLITGFTPTTIMAYSAHTQSEAVAWAQSQLGKALDYDGKYGAQCVDLICYYYQYLGTTSPGGNAEEYRRNNLPSGWTRVYENYQPGDIAVWKPSYRNDHIYLNGLYEYKNGSWKRILNLNNCFGKYRQYERGDVISCSGNTLKVRHEVMTWSLGLCRVDYTYAYKSGKLKRTSTYGKLISQSIRGGGKYLKVKSNINVYKYCGSGKKLLTLRRGAKIRVEKWRVVNGKFYYQINCKGRRGWINGITKRNSVGNPQYSNVYYV